MLHHVRLLSYLFIKIAKNQPWMDQKHFKYLDNCTCYDTVVCTILFSSIWRVYWYKLLSVLSTLRKWQNFDETPSIYIVRGFSPISSILSQFETLRSLECAVDSEWNSEINFVVTCSVVELFVHEVHQNQPSMAQELSKILCILTTVHATTKSFVPFCLPQ